MVGTFRPALGWVGGTSPFNAAYVPPPPSEIPRLADDLIAFANREPEDLDPVSHAAVIHAQFEAIHPYGDGNGRLGRAARQPNTATAGRDYKVHRAHQHGHCA